MPVKETHMVVGLGNPGDDYHRTRHNAGFRVVDALARRFGIDVNRKKFDGWFGRGTVAGVPAVLLKPMAYMNRSGPPVRRIADYFKVSLEDILVVHDDIDLPFGRLKIKQKGGDGGHKGVRSIMDALGGGAFVRLRVGIGRPDAERDVTGHVLGDFDSEESRLLDPIVAAAGEAVVTVLSSGTKEGMNRFNDRRSHILP